MDNVLSSYSYLGRTGSIAGGPVFEHPSNGRFANQTVLAPSTYLMITLWTTVEELRLPP